MKHFQLIWCCDKSRVVWRLVTAQHCSPRGEEEEGVLRGGREGDEDGGRIWLRATSRNQSVQWPERSHKQQAGAQELWPSLTFMSTLLETCPLSVSIQ